MNTPNPAANPGLLTDPELSYRRLTRLIVIAIWVVREQVQYVRDAKLAQGTGIPGTHASQLGDRHARQIAKRSQRPVGTGLGNGTGLELAS
jgi:signal transduction histidine kinase